MHTRPEEILEIMRKDYPNFSLDDAYCFIYNAEKLVRKFIENEFKIKVSPKTKREKKTKPQKEYAN